MNDSKTLLIVAALLATAVALSVWQQEKNGVTTETAAAAAGTRVEPTNLKLRVEPK